MAAKTQSQKRLEIEIIKQMITLFTSGLGLVSALAWNSLIQDLVTNYINPYLPKGSSLVSLAIYAVVITVFAVIVTYQLTSLLGKLEKQKHLFDYHRIPFFRKNKSLLQKTIKKTPYRTDRKP